MPRPNQFLAALTSGTPQIGLWLNLSDPVAVEIAASSGFDWVLVDTEHAPWSLDAALRALTIVAGYPTAAMVRVGDHDPHRIGRLLDIGSQSLLVPMVNTAAQARAIVDACEFPPRGKRGVASQTRAGSWGRDPEYLAKAGEQQCLVIQIESAQAVENIDEILAVEGIDAIFVGPADLAASLGHLGNPDHPTVQEAIRRVERAAQTRGMPLGTLTRDLDAARQYLARGYTFIAVGTDTAVLAQGLRSLRATIADS